MRDKTWTDILNVLCIAILVDGKVYKEEVDTFLHVAKKMNAIISDGMMLTDHMLRDWFLEHRDDIANDLQTQVRGKYLKDNLCKIDDPKVTESLLACMIAISRSDNVYHELEESMVERAAKIWGWDMEDFNLDLTLD